MPELKLENSIVDDRYLIDVCLGRGSYAEIFLAADEARANQQVIIKALNTTLQGTPDADLERTLVENFQNEALALDRVRHPHIIRRLGHGTAADLRAVPFHYLVLEYMPGGDLLGLCRKRPLTLADALIYFQQIAEALAYAHSQGVIHRDIKPKNLLLSADRRLMKIADFGVAKMTLDDLAEITRVGTNFYAPPEHHPDSPTDGLIEKLTPSADVYSLAKTIYTALTGRPPRNFVRRPISELPAEFAVEPWSSALLAVLSKATASRVADRYQTVQECWAELARLEVHIRGAEADPEATIVRSRLSGTSTAERAASMPDFHALATAHANVPHPQKARIVVELPQRDAPAARWGDAAPQLQRDAERAARGDAERWTGRDAGALDQQTQPESPSDVAIPAAGAAHSANGQQGTSPTAARAQGAGVALAEKPAASLATKRFGSEPIEPTFSHRLRTLVRSDWLKRAFIVLLLATLIGIVAQVYLFFAGGMPSGRRGVISGAANVNLRSAPRGDIVAVLPEGTIVVTDEIRENWAHVKVSSSVPGLADPAEGWVDNRFVKEEQ